MRETGVLMEESADMYEDYCAQRTLSHKRYRGYRNNSKKYFDKKKVNKALSKRNGSVSMIDT